MNQSSIPRRGLFALAVLVICFGAHFVLTSHSPMPTWSTVINIVPCQSTNLSSRRCLVVVSNISRFPIVLDCVSLETSYLTNGLWLTETDLFAGHWLNGSFLAPHRLTETEATIRSDTRKAKCSIQYRSLSWREQIPYWYVRHHGSPPDALRPLVTSFCWRYQAERTRVEPSKEVDLTR